MRAASNQSLVERRDGDEKEAVPLDRLAERIPLLLDRIQQDLLVCAQRRLAANTVSANSFDELRQILEGATAEKGGGKFVYTHIKDDPACDAKAKEIKASIRCIPLVDEHDGPGKCIITGEPVPHRAVVAKAY